MAFRADEAAARGYEQARSYLVPRKFSPDEREKAEQVLSNIIDELGPVVEAYPTWHPLVAHHDNTDPGRLPSERCGYKGLDHKIYFAHGFITCPYHSGDQVIESVNALPPHHCASISAEKLDVKFYNDGTIPVLVRCDWTLSLEAGNTIPKSIAVPLMLEKELPAWRWAQRAETWETMRPYLLGDPHGSRSSLFVTQQTALAMKNIYLAMVETGMFGPLKMG